MNAQIYDRVRGIAADILHLDPALVTPDSSPQSVESWDSVQHLNLVLALEEQFGIQFEPEEMDAMKNIGAIAGLVARKNGA